MTVFRWAVVCSAAMLVGSPAAHSQPSFQAPHAMTDKPLYDTLLLSSGQKVSYRVSVPARYDDAVPAPVLIALPPGDQSRAMVDVGMSRYWAAGAAKGWVVVSPAAFGDNSFVDVNPDLFQEFVDAITALHRPEGGRVHLAGVSNGGRSAFRLATLLPNHFASVLAAPGFAPTAEDFERLSAINCPVRMLVGETDTRWVTESRATLDRLKALGKDASLEVRPGDGHMVSATGDDMFRMLDGLRPNAAPNANQAPPLAAQQTPDALIGAVLDDFHDAAAKADGPRYFALFAPDGVFLGTDDTERWTVDEFRAYAEPYFSQGKGWIYLASDRHIRIHTAGSTAWFDEKLDNEKYGRCRGSGVLVKHAGAWKIAQYNLTVPIPNDLLADVAVKIREAAKANPGVK